MKSLSGKTAFITGASAGIGYALAEAFGEAGMRVMLAGINETEFPVLMNSSRIYEVPDDLSAGEAIVRYAPEERLRMAGYLWPEVPERLAESPYLWTESIGQGRIIAFAGDPNFRDMWRGLLPLFANAVLIGPSMCTRLLRRR